MGRVRRYPIELGLALGLFAAACGHGKPGGATGTGGAGGAGGAAPPATPAFVSGSRLRAQIYDGGEARAFVHWHDMGPHENCSFVHATDGRWRCLPDSGTVSYLDAACTMPIAVFPPDEVPPLKVRDAIVPTDACYFETQKVTVYPVGASVTLPMPPGDIYYREGPDCFSTQAYADSLAFSVRDPIDPAQFVAAELVDEPRGPGLAARIFEAEDGARQIWRIVDVGRGEECALPAVPSTAFESGPCVPSNFAFPYAEYADASCTEPTVIASETCPPTIAMSWKFSACGDTTLAFNELGDVLSSVFSRNNDGQCLPSQGFGVEHRLGRSIAESELPALFHDTVGTGRLRARELAARDGGGRFMADDYSFFDAQLNAPCTPTPFCDGNFRCLPNLPKSSRLFTDAACTQPIAFIQELTDCPTAVPPTRFAYYPGACSDADSVNDLGPALDPPATWRIAPDGCIPYPVTHDPGYRYHAVGAPVPVDTYATVDKRVE
jgi:hypothetical protein